MNTITSSHCKLIKAYASLLVALLFLQESRAETVLEFDGRDDRVLVPYDDSFPTEVFTLAAWIKLSPPVRRSAIIARGEDDDSWNLSWQLYVNPDGTLQIMLENQNEQNFCYPLTCMGQTQPSCSAQDNFVADDQWRHVAATRDLSGRLQLYIDGESRVQCDQTGVPSSNNFQYLSIGCTHGTIGPPPGGVEPPIWFFSGAIDDPAVWNVALSSSDVEQVHDHGVDATNQNLIGFWTFDEGSGRYVIDLSASGNHGFLGAVQDPDNADPQWVLIGGTGDSEQDGDVDIDDFARFLACHTGPGGTVGPNCAFADFEGDDDVDLNDWGGFILAFTSP